MQITIFCRVIQILPKSLLSQFYANPSINFTIKFTKYKCNRNFEGVLYLIIKVFV